MNRIMRHSGAQAKPAIPESSRWIPDPHLQRVPE